MKDTTLTTNSDPKKHFGQNSYADVIASAVFAKMVAAGVL